LREPDALSGAARMAIDEYDLFVRHWCFL
jgi:hypothetical protein